MAETQITVPEASPLIPIMGAQQLKAQFEAFESMKVAILDPKDDTYVVQGVARIRKSGWRKLALAFNLSDEVLQEYQEFDPKDPLRWVWHVQVKVSSRGGRSVIGVASCSSTERKFAHPEHDTHAMAHTRAKSRAIADMLAAADLVAEEEEDAPASSRPAQQQPTKKRVLPASPFNDVDGKDSFGKVYSYWESVVGPDLIRICTLNWELDRWVCCVSKDHKDQVINEFLSTMARWDYTVQDQGEIYRVDMGKSNEPGTAPKG